MKEGACGKIDLPDGADGIDTDDVALLVPGILEISIRNASLSTSKIIS